MNDVTHEPVGTGPADGSSPPDGRWWAPTSSGAAPSTPPSDATPSDATPSDATPSDATPSETTTPQPSAPAPGRSRRRLLIGLGILLIVAAGALAAALLGLFERDGGTAPTPQTVVLPSPTPTIAPVARQPTSAFADSLPASVLQYALTSVAEHPPLLAAGAVEGYRLDYSDGGTGTVTVTAGQWETPEEAATALAAAVAAAGAPPADATEPTSGDVQVGGAVVGTWTLTQGADGAGTVTWSNGTAVLQATAPMDVVRDVYAAYPY